MRNINFTVSKIAFIVGLFLFISSSCQREFSETLDQQTGQPVSDIETVIGGIEGIVIDENNQPVTGASVSSGANTTITNTYGVFSFRKIRLSKANGSVKVSKPGYFTAYRTFASTAGRINNVRLKLIPKNNSGSFIASAGGIVNIAGGGKLVIPASSVTDASGNDYTGQVNVAMAWINPSSSDLPYQLIGDLRGITTSGQERGLSTYGMLGVELAGTGGQQLKMAAGKTAELSFPIPPSLQASAPSVIDLWYFDETAARWKQEGTATKNGANYIAIVSHFSFWNCDEPFPLIELCLSLKDQNNQPLVNVLVKVKRLVNGTYGFGRTDSLGVLCGKVPKDEPLLLEVAGIGNCSNEIVYTQNIGPFSTNTTLNTITINIPSADYLMIYGKVVNCSGVNVTNGAALIYVAGGYQYTVPVSLIDGTFGLSLLRCNNSPVVFSVIGVDYGTSQQSTPVAFTAISGGFNTGTLQACGTSSTEFIDLVISGTHISITTPPDNIGATDSVGTPPFTNKTYIRGLKQAAGTLHVIDFSFENNGMPGVYTLASLLYMTNTNTYAVAVTPYPPIYISVFGSPLSGFIEGSFIAQITNGGPPQNVSCSFRVRRN